MPRSHNSYPLRASSFAVAAHCTAPADAILENRSERDVYTSPQA